MKITPVFRAAFTALLFLCLTAKAQVEKSHAFADTINYIFEHVDKAKVPHGLLLDTAMEFTNLAAFEGTLTDSNYVQLTSYKAIYNTLLMAQVNGNSMYNPTEFRDRWNAKRKTNLVTISGICYKYSKLSDDALVNNKIILKDGQLSDSYINAVWQNPYTEKEVFAMCPPVMKMNTLKFDVVVPKDIFYSNHPDDIASLAIDFGDGNGYHDITFDTAIPLSYKEKGGYTWTYRLQFTNTAVLYSWSPIYIFDLTTDDDERDEPVSVPFTGTTAWDNAVATATLQISYAPGHAGKLKKPLIVAEGIDPAFIEPENPMGSTNITTFYTEIIDNSGELPDALSSYDIVYVNWDNSFDYIQRNAYLLEDIIAFVNNSKDSTTKNVVLGQSMGGLVARYALKDMENKNIDHQTSLYISHDAPHRGANVPVSYQYLFRHIYNKYIDLPTIADFAISQNDQIGLLDDAQEMFDSPSPRQMLSTYIKSDYSIDNEEHTAWQEELDALGYPEHTRNVAVSNGNFCANPQEFNPGDELFSMYGDVSLTFWSNVVASIPGVSFFTSGYVGAALENWGVFFAGMLPGGNRMHIDFWAKAMPESGTEQIYNGYMAYVKKILWMTITVSITNKHLYAPENALPYDYYPGGYYNIDTDIESKWEDAGSYEYGMDIDFYKKFSFVPTASAFDVGHGQAELENTDYLNKYSALTPPASPKDIPFANFIAPSNITAENPLGINQKHISFTANIGNWLAKELDSDASDDEVYDCTILCETTEISGPETACSSAVYSIPDAVTVTSWYILPVDAGTLTPVAGTNQVTMNFDDNFSGNLTITAKVNVAGCGSKKITKQTWVGSPATPSLSGISNAGKGSLVSYMANADGATYYQWTLPGAYSVVTNFNYSGANWQIKQSDVNNAAIGPFTGTGGYSGTVTVKACNECGCSATATMNVTVSATGIGIFPQSPENDNSGGIYRIAPNPADSYTKVTLFDTANTPAVNAVITAALYDLYGTYKAGIKITDNEAYIDLSSYTEGMYILAITIDGNTESHLLSIER